MDKICKDGLTVGQKAELIEKEMQILKSKINNKGGSSVVVEINGKQIDVDTAFTYSNTDKELFIFTEDKELQFNEENADIEIMIRVNSEKEAKTELEYLREENSELRNNYYGLCESIINRKDTEEVILKDIQRFGGVLHSVFTADIDFLKVVNMLVKEHESLTERCNELMELTDRQNKILAGLEAKGYDIWS